MAGLLALAGTHAPRGTAQEQAQSAATTPRVTDVTLANSDAARAQFSIQGDRLLFDKVDRNGWTRLWTVRADGSFERCLTCDNPDFTVQHTGDARWHPSGDLIVFVVERPLVGNRRGSKPPTPFMAVPGRNRSSDLWLVTADGKRFWNLTNTAARGGAPVASPAFSHEGDRLAWSQREAASGGSAWGSWVAQVGRFRYQRATPHLSRVVARRSTRAGFLTVAGFAPDDRSLDVAGPPLQPPFVITGQDLFRLPMDPEADGAEITPWTDSPTTWDGHLAFAPDGNLAVFASSEGFGVLEPLRRDSARFLPRTELWIANRGGDLLRRLTGFNNPTTDHYLGEPAHIGPAAWTPEGDALLVTVTPLSTPGRPSLFRVDLSE